MWRDVRLCCVVLVGLLGAWACSGKSPLSTGEKPIVFEPTIRQGVWGQVRFYEGDFMPTWIDTTDPEQVEWFRNRNSVTPVVRDVFFFEKAHFTRDVDPIGSTWFARVKTPLAGRTRSDRNGFFEISLPEGEYSMFVWETTSDLPDYCTELRRTGAAFYANGDDGQGYIRPVAVVRDSVVRADFRIDYLATS